MNPETSPFRPGRPVPIEFFVGRSAEIERLRSMVRRSAKGTLGIGFVTGERGIGKSSLAAFVRHLVEQDGHAVGCHVHLGGVDGVHEMLNQTFHRLLNESIDKPWHKQLTGFLGNRVQRAGLFGITLDLKLTGDDLETLARDFVPSMKRLLESLPRPKQTIFLVLDDINGLARSEAFANWLKSSVDEFTTSSPEAKLCILIVGLEGRRRELVASQPSLARVFELIDIAPWSDAEVSDFYRQSFARAGAEIRIFEAIQSERYRSILRQIQDRPRMRFRRSEVLDRLPGQDQRALDNSLRRMKDLGAIEADPEIRGGYRFPNRLHALYFFMESQRHFRGGGRS